MLPHSSMAMTTLASFTTPQVPATKKKPGEYPLLLALSDSRFVPMLRTFHDKGILVFTVTAAWPDTPAEVALMVTLPAPVADITPLPDTEPMCGLLEVHVTVPVTSISLESLIVAMAVNCC